MFLLTIFGMFRKLVVDGCYLNILKRFSHYTPDGYSKVIALNEVKRFCIDSMKKVGTNEKHAKALADVLVEGDYRGHYSHGLNRLGTKIYRVYI